MPDTLLATSQDTLGCADHSMSTLGLSTTELALFPALSLEWGCGNNYMRRADSSEKTLMLRMIENKRRRG